MLDKFFSICFISRMRSVWKGSIRFGLVNIPIRLYHASKERELKFKLLHSKDRGEIRYIRMCKADGKEVPWEEIVKGFDVGGGKYVIFTDEDFKRANPEKTRTIEILDFIHADEVDPTYFIKPYYLEPEKGAAKAYILLREALTKSKRVGVGSFVFRNHEHLGLIKPYEDILILIQVRYASEMLSPKDLHIPHEKALSKKELEIAIQLIEKMTTKFDPKNYVDTYTQELKDLIKKKAKGKKIKPKKEEEEKPSKKVHDIMSLLEESMKGRKSKKRRKSA